ncbi:hypothetical protein GLOIN_2v1789090 [Rhizophagus clarus]|uniref:Uncharacterized protein n=1 Tax=Rhizophagus clarus TaxID=94130 RepID=A0A8H3QI52_9GLOM|nr:hypothetical protein GLOIN_2v1789090 [Rhizophagus clarus]
MAIISTKTLAQFYGVLLYKKKDIIAIQENLNIDGNPVLEMEYQSNEAAGKKSGRWKVSGEYKKKGYESCIARTNSVLRASSLAIKMVMDRIARMAQHRHFVSHPQQSK